MAMAFLSQTASASSCSTNELFGPSIVVKPSHLLVSIRRSSFRNFRLSHRNRDALGRILSCDRNIISYPVAEETSQQILPETEPEREGDEFKDRREDEVPLSKGVLIWRAIKLPIYSVAIVPLSVGSAVAYWQTRNFFARRYFLFLGSAALVIAWLNLSNDAYDAETGVDKGKKESVVNMTGSRKGVLIAAYLCLIFGASGLIFGALQAQNLNVIALLTGAIFCGYVYQCPPFRLSYLGLGEPLCFIAFGPLATTAFYFTQAGSSPLRWSILGSAILVGITTTLILFCSHFHQINGDKLVGKLSPLVRLGTEKGKDVVKIAVASLYSLVFIFAATKVIPYQCALCLLLTAPVGKLVVDFVTRNHNDKAKIFLAKYFCVRLHVAFGAALVLGFLVASKMSGVVA